MERINAESNRAAEMGKSFEAKKQILTAQLNDLTPKEKKWKDLDDLRASGKPTLIWIKGELKTLL